MKDNPFRQTPGSDAGYRPLRKLRTAFSGIVQAVLLDFSVQYKLIASLVFLALAGWYESAFHFLFVLTVTGLLLMAEIFNTVIEELCDYLRPEYDVRIGRIKDMAAAAATLAVTIWLSVLLFVGYELLIRSQ